MKVNAAGVIEPLERRTMLAAVPVGGEFRVNTYTTNGQLDPSVGMDANGDFVIAWSSIGQDGDGYGVYAQRFNNGGIAQGNEFRVNTSTAGNQSNPEVAMDADGDFVVVWNSSFSGVSTPLLQRFNAAGALQGGEINLGTGGVSGIAMDANGDFAVTTVGYGQVGGSNWDVYAQRFNAAGVSQGAQFRVNTYTSNEQYRSDIDMNSAGDFVITWHSKRTTNLYGVYARRYNAAGAALGDEFLVKSFTSGVVDPVVAISDSGSFVIGYSVSGLRAQRYNSAGVAQGFEIPVVNDLNSSSYYKIAMDAEGNFAFISHPLSQPDVYAVCYNAVGERQASSFRANTFTTGNQAFASIDMDPSGDFVIAWNGSSQDGSNYGVYAQRYSMSPAANFATFSYATLPLKLDFTFDMNVSGSLDSGDITIARQPGGPSVAASLSNYNATTNIATFVINGAAGLPDGNYRATLNAAGIHSVAGRPMASNFVFDFFTLAGDANHNRTVDISDLGILAANWQGTNKTFSKGDFNYDGIVDISDLGILAANWQQTIPQSALAAPVAVGSPTRTDRIARDVLWT